MSRFVTGFLLALCLIGIARSAIVSYEGYSVVRLIPRNQQQVDTIISWVVGDALFKTWNEIRGYNRSIDVLLSKEWLDKYKGRFAENNIEYQIVNPNVQNSIRKQEKANARMFQWYYNRNTRVSSSVPGSFARFSQIISFLEGVAQSNPSYAVTYNAGKTYENRDLRVLRLKTPTAQRKVWIDCGIHAISPATCVWMIDKLVKGYNQGEQIARNVLNYYEIHIIPVLNPDGYEYTFTNDRMWRKNRNPNGGRGCYGVDLNRNFDLAWMKNGASSNKCSDVYAGRYGNSELEIQAMERVITTYKGTWDAVLTFHSYGNWWFTPYGYTKNLPADYADLYRKAIVATNAIKSVYGTQYTVGSSANLLYTSSGGTEDWTKDIGGVKYSYCVELGPEDSNPDGFILPASKIQPIGDETYQGVMALLNEIMNAY